MEYLGNQALKRDLNNTAQTSRSKLPTVETMAQFFATKFGKSIKPFVERTKHTFGNSSIYRAVEDISKDIKRGDLLYIDRHHGTEIEVFNKRGKYRCTINTDGIKNEGKSLAGMGRTIPV